MSSIMKVPVSDKEHEKDTGSAESILSSFVFSCYVSNKFTGPSVGVNVLQL